MARRAHFHQGIERTLALLGCASVADLDASYVDWPASWGGKPD